jgi:opacity protein-like surface antigen
MSLSIALALAAAIRPASAADLGVDAQIYQPRPLAVIFRWTGVYVGAHAGGGFGKKSESAVPFPVFPGALVFDSPMSIGLSGWLAGGQVGANYQVGSWVWGIEAQASAADLNGSSVCASTTVAAAALVAGLPPVSGSANCNSKVDVLGTVAGRLGVAFDRFLVYGKAGFAWTNDSYQSRFFTLTGAQLLFSANETRWGWMVGLGLEYGFTDNWSAKIEYNYMDMGSRSLQFTEPTSLATLVSDITERVHVVKIGVNYRLGARSIFVDY